MTGSRNTRARARLAWLEQTLAGGGTLHLADAAQHWAVSPMTIRRDVEASDGRLSVLAGRLMQTDHPRFAPIYDIGRETDKHLAAKQRVTRQAAALIQPDDTIFVDCGTTLIHLVAALDPDMPVTVITYALNVANAVAQRPATRLTLLGGVYYPSSDSLADARAPRTIRGTGINIAFISAAGVHVDRGVSCFHHHEVALKQAALETAQQRVLVTDDSKTGQLRPALFARYADFDDWFTSSTAQESGQPQDDRTVSGPRIHYA